MQAVLNPPSSRSQLDEEAILDKIWNGFFTFALPKISVKIFTRRLSFNLIQYRKNHENKTLPIFRSITD